MRNDPIIDPIGSARKSLASAGGLARAKKLTKKRRSEIARMGAVAKNKKRKATV